MTRFPALWRLNVSTVKGAHVVEPGGAATPNAGDAGDVADSRIAAREPMQMLGKPRLVNLMEFELEVADMVTNHINP